jgi:tRNA-2-methylthio-N6-dimethylallyladenosine synthase
MKKFFIETYGCQMNKSDSNTIFESLKAAGFSESEFQDQADIIIINTCSVRKTAENRIWGRLGYYRSLKKTKDITVLVTGCMAQRLGEELFFNNDTVDIVVGTFQRHRIPGILKDLRKNERIAFVEENDLIFSDSFPDKDNPKKAFVTISHGCNNYCSYCIVPFLRGRERSRPSGDIIKDINELSKKGVVQVTLLGQNVNSYGNDTHDMDFPSLLKMVCRETDISWIKYLSSHPKDFSDALIDVIASENKVAKWLHLAVQSGSNSVLQKMNRKYKIEDYIEKTSRLKKMVPKLNLTTDLIVGFPGETDRDFQDTLDLMRNVQFDDAYMYRYNIRENTVAAKDLADDVPDKVKSERLTALIDLQREITGKRKLSRVGDDLEVIADRWSKRSKKEILGLTKEDLMIIFKGDENDFNDIIKLKAVRLEGNTLYGERT